jgi:hypothetical protein
MMIALGSIVAFIQQGELPRCWLEYCDPTWLCVKLKRGQWVDYTDALTVNNVMIRQSPRRGIEAVCCLVFALEDRARQDRIPLVAINAIPKIGRFLRRRGYTQHNPNIPEEAQQTWKFMPNATPCMLK